METKIFDVLLEPTFVLNAEKKIIYCNEPAALLTDLSVRKLMRSQPVFDVLFKFETPLSGLQDLNTVADSTPYQEIHFTTEAGKTGKVQVTFQPFESQDEKAISWLVYFRDVTLEETLQKKYRAELEQKEGYIRELESAREKLEDYSKNLEKMVAERTAQLSRLNQLTTALLDSLGQGFFIFDQEGSVLEIASKACQQTIEKDPRGLKIWEALSLPAKSHAGFQNWMTTLFSEMLPFEDLAPLGPPMYKHSEGHDIQLQYYPLRNESGAMEGVVVVATDITSLVAAQKEATFEKAHASMILKLIKNKRQVASFIRESQQMLEILKLELLKPQPEPELTFRMLHTLKGGAASFSVHSFAVSCHQAETLLTEWKSLQDEPSLQKLREQCQTLPRLFQEFLKENEMILGNLEKLSERWIESSLSQFTDFAGRQLPATSTPLREAFFEHFLYEPVESLFSHYDEITLNVADNLGKKVNPLKIKNPQFRILPEPYETLFGTLIHAFRNAVDHGIETPEVRSERGKPTAGQISLWFEKKNDQLLFCIEDDGGGINPERIRKKLTEKGLSVQNESDEQIIQHIFDSQFSTAEQVTDVSGRGIGMDAILQSAKNLGGRAWVESKLTEGTRLFIQVPWIGDFKKEWRQSA